MIDGREILAMAGALGFLPNVVEKDYVLSWVLAGIFQHPVLSGTWVFKGGTCLKKCYFETYRFSEDLDFTLTDPDQLDNAFLLPAFREIADWVYEQSGIELPADGMRFDIYQNHRGHPAGQGRMAYRGPIAPRGGDLPRIRLDLTADEVLVCEPADRRIAHAYSDEPEGGIMVRCYAYEEAFAEKIRALGERARPRDLYDVVNLYRNNEFLPEAPLIYDILQQKCTFKALDLPSWQSLQTARAELEGDWEAMLRHQLPILPPVVDFWDELRAVFAWMLGEERAAVPSAYPLAEGETVLHAPIGRLEVPTSGTSFIEIIRFAASNRLCVELDYIDEQGRRSTRIIEPYSLRRTLAGNIVLHAVRVDNNLHRSYRADRILSARATELTFIPRYAIELTPSGPLIAPSTIRTSTLAAPRLSRSRRRSAGWQSGPIYIYECGFCGKKFEYKTRNPTLRPHKDRSGWPCSGRWGLFVDTKW
jgi:predicted nucleotidyltransferase component of viral defense system